MAKTKRTGRPDQHKSALLVRLPEWCRPLLAELKAKNRRPSTTELLVAFEKHCRDEGIKLPKEEDR